MLTHWNNLLNTDCIVVDVGPHTIYPIFKNGSSSLMSVADKTYVNKQITECNNIDIIIRDPETRFVAGLNEYCQQNNLDIEDTWELVYEGKLINRHFAPQWLWLLHLYKFYKGTVVLKSFKSLTKYCSVRKNKSVKKIDVALINNFVEIDYKLMDHINETTDLETLIRKYKNVLS